MRAAALPLLAAALAGGCTAAEDGRYPSLLPRPVESQGFDEPVRPLPVATPDPALDARVAELSAALDAASAGFNAAAQDAEARIAVARGLPEGSEPWLDAQAALTSLDAARQPTGGAVADLERLAIERGEKGLPPFPALDAAVTRAEAAQAAQEARVAGLEAALAGN